MREVHKKLQPSADIRAGTAYELPVEDASVDAIICAQVSWKYVKINYRRFTGLAMLRLSRSLQGLWNPVDQLAWYGTFTILKDGPTIKKGYSYVLSILLLMDRRKHGNVSRIVHSIELLVGWRHSIRMSLANIMNCHYRLGNIDGLVLLQMKGYGIFFVH